MALAGRAALLAIGLSCGVLGNAQQPPVNMVATVRTADANCGSCHAQILHTYLATPMANASGVAVKRLKTGTLDHKPSGVKYSLSLEGSQLLLTKQDPKDPAIAARGKLEFFLGSVQPGLIYHYSLNGYLFESPIAYYSASRVWT
jgi:hypothetical protein